jgi:hypothetical protein
MPKAELLPKINAPFEQSVNKLAVEGETLSSAYEDVTKRILDFARRFHGLWLRSLDLDKGIENGVHRLYLRDSLAAAIGTDDKSIRSRWIQIGQHATELTPLKSSLPPTRDSLYEVALAIEAKKPVAKWIEDGTLTAQTSVRGIRILRDQQKRNPSKKKKKRSVPKAFTATVTLCFNNYDDALRILTPLLISDEPFKLVPDKTMVNSLKTLSEADNAKAQDKLA